MTFPIRVQKQIKLEDEAQVILSVVLLVPFHPQPPPLPESSSQSFPCPLSSRIFAFIPVLILSPSHKPKQNKNSPVCKQSECLSRWQGTPDYQRYLPLSGREGPRKTQLGKRDRVETGLKGSQAARAVAFSFFQKRHLLGGHPPEAGKVGRHTGAADGLAAARHCRPCQGTLKSSVLASCHECKQQQSFSWWNSFLVIPISCPQLPIPCSGFPPGPLLKASSNLIYPGNQERLISSQTRWSPMRHTDFSQPQGEVNEREAKAAGCRSMGPVTETTCPSQTRESTSILGGNNG